MMKPIELWNFWKWKTDLNFSELFEIKKDFNQHFHYYSKRLDPRIRDLIDYYSDEILTNKYLFFRGYLKKLLIKYFVCYTEDLEFFYTIKKHNAKA